MDRGSAAAPFRQEVTEEDIQRIKRGSVVHLTPRSYVNTSVKNLALMKCRGIKITVATGGYDIGSSNKTKEEASDTER